MNDFPVEFYSPWPKFGTKPINKQWQEIRRDTETMQVLARAMGVYLDPGGVRKDDVLARWMQGEQNFFNRFSTFYDKNDGRWKIQKNIGTEKVPNWKTAIQITQDCLVQDGSGAGLFYGNITVRQTNDEAEFTGIRVASFNSDTFYITQGTRSDEAIINFRGEAGGGGGGTGDVTNGVSLGGDEAIFAGKSGSILQFKGLTAGSNITLTPSGTDITIESSGSGSGSGTKFYGVNVKQTDDEASFKGINTLAFNTDLFYITQNEPNTDEAVINFRGLDHGELGGLGDNDHPQYLLKSEEGKFYGSVVKQHSGIASFSGVKVFSFEDDAFYITQNEPNTDEVMVNFRGMPGPQGPQGPSGLAIGTIIENKTGVEWIVNHNLDSTSLLWNVFDDAQEAVIPEKVDVSNPDIAYFYFLEPVTGSVILSSGSPGSFPTIKQVDTDTGIVDSWENITAISFNSENFYITQNPSGNTNEALVNFRTEFTPTRMGTFSINTPVEGDNQTGIHSTTRIDLQRVDAVLNATGGSPSVHWTIYTGADRSGSDREILLGETTTSTTSAELYNANNSFYLETAQDFVWLEVDTVAGTIDELAVTMWYKIMGENL